MVVVFRVFVAAGDILSMCVLVVYHNNKASQSFFLWSLSLSLSLFLSLSLSTRAKHTTHRKDRETLKKKNVHKTLNFQPDTLNTHGIKP